MFAGVRGGVGPGLWLLVGGLNKKNNGLGSPIQLCQGGGAGPIIFAPEPPPLVGGPRVVAIGHWVGELRLSVTGLNRKITG